MYSMHTVNFVLVDALLVQIFGFKLNHVFCYINWQKGFIHLKLIPHVVLNICYENIKINSTLWVCLYMAMDAVIFVSSYCLSEPKAAIIAISTSQIIIWCHAKIYAICYFSLSVMSLEALGFELGLGLDPCYPHEICLVNRDSWCNVQCCVQRFTLLDAIVDEQNDNEHRFLSPELKYRRSLIEIIRRLRSVPIRKIFHTDSFNL